jgi:hypothetical protein
VWFTFIGIISFAGAQTIMLAFNNSIDMLGLGVFLYGSIYGMVNRAFKAPP